MVVISNKLNSVPVYYCHGDASICVVHNWILGGGALWMIEGGLIVYEARGLHGVLGHLIDFLWIWKNFGFCVKIQSCVADI